MCAALTLATTACGAGPAQLAAAASASPSSQPAASAKDDLAPTQWGPLSAADMKLMTLVRETSLREITTSQWSEQRSANPLVRQAAQMIISQHIQLQDKDLAAAKTLGITLPNAPAADMQVGIDRMRTETGTTFDQDYVNTLRQAHGAALILIAQVRADTRNSVVRSLADLANNFIMMHTQVLEKTGDVDYSKLPVPQA